MMSSFYATDDDDCSVSTLKLLKIRIPQKFAVITVKFEQGGFTIK